MKYPAYIPIAAFFASAAGAEPAMLGIADSASEYVVGRDQTFLKNPPRTMSTIQEGDKVAAMKTPVKVQTLSGDVVIIGQDSEVSIAGPSAVELHSGTMIMTMGPRAEATTVTYQDLAITSEPPAKTDGEETTLLAMNASGETVRVSSSASAFAITEAETGRQLALVTKDAPATLTRTDAGWQQGVASPVIVAERQTRPYVLQQQGQPVAQQNESSPSNGGGGGDFARGAVFGGITGLALGAGGVYLYKDQREDDKNDDDGDDKQIERPCVSPIFFR